MRDQKPEPNQPAKAKARIVPLGDMRDLTGHDGHGAMDDGGGISTSNRKDKGRGAGE